MEANSNTTAVGELTEGAPSGLRSRIGGFLRARLANGAGRPIKRAAPGETGRMFEKHLEGTEALVLHHRQLPGKAGEVSHLIVGPAGITVVDARNYGSGRARVGRGGIRVGRRNRVDLIERVRNQVDALHELLADTPYAEVPVEAALAWRDVEGLPILHSLNGPRVLICGTRKLAREAARPGPLSARRVKALSAFLAAELPSA